MKRIWMMILFCSPVFGQQQKLSVSDLSWLSGLWRMDQNGTITEESWTGVISNKMDGRSTTKRNDKIVEQETIVIDQDGSGTIFYNAKPSKQKGASFKLAKMDSLNVTFENLKHDFPQRIMYQRILPDSLIASIQGIVKGKMKTILYPYIKVIINAD